MPLNIIPNDDERSSHVTEFPDRMSCCDEGGSSSSSSYHSACSIEHHRRACAFDSSLRKKREQEGRCADCGLQTHEIHIDTLTRQAVKIPLTLAGEVHRGRCLFCFPVFAFQCLIQRRQEQSQPAPHSESLHESRSSNLVTFMDTDDEEEEAMLPSDSPSLSLGLMSVRPGCRRRVSQVLTDQHGNISKTDSYHDPTNLLVQQALSVLQGNTFDIVDILAAMKRVPHDLTVQERGCERLWILSWEDENAAAIGRVGGIDIILKAMARFPSSQRLQLSATEALQNLAAKSDYNQDEICELGGVPLVVQAMMRHLNCAGIQQCGCTALASLASGCRVFRTCCHRSRSTRGYSSFNDRRRCITAAGGFHAIIISARHYAADDSVLRAAYDALSALGYDPAGRLPAQRQPMMIPADDVDK